MAKASQTSTSLSFHTAQRPFESGSARSLGLVGGIDRPFSRLFQGFDPNIVNFLIQNGVPRGTVDEMFDPAKWSMQVLFDGMPAQDAVNFAEFVLKTTIGVSEFETGNPLCGGPLQVLFISADNKIGWISQPKLSLRG